MIKDNEILKQWDSFTDANKMYEIQNNPLIEYWEIWSKIDDIFQTQILNQPSIDYKKYIDICGEKKKIILYEKNISLMSIDLDWENLNSKTQTKCCFNPYFDYEKYWDLSNTKLY